MVRYLKHRDVYLVEIIKDVGYIKKKNSSMLEKLRMELIKKKFSFVWFELVGFAEGA